LLTKIVPITDGYVGFEPGAKGVLFGQNPNETVTRIGYTGAPVTESDLDAVDF
jgi:hypothetical protein